MVNGPGRKVLRCMLALAICVWPGLSWGQAAGHAPEKIIIDTDIGDDVDDAFALALAVRSPELQILGVMTTFGDNDRLAAMLRQMVAPSLAEPTPAQPAAESPTSQV